MIKFFRRIRQRLLSENKFSKYLLYAIGEIVLVVIGILIALQINNWNTKQNDKNIENAYIADILQDLSRDTSILSSKFDNLVELKKDALKKVKKHLTEAPSKFDTLDFLKDVGIGAIYGKRELLLNNSTYIELTSTGNFRVISDKVLRKKIINYYNLCDIMLRTIREQRTSYPDFVNSIRAFDPKQPNHIEEVDQKFALNCIQTKNEEFRRLLNQEMTFAYNLDELPKRIKDTAVSLIEYINKK